MQWMLTHAAKTGCTKRAQYQATGGQQTPQMWQTPIATEGADCGNKWETLKNLDKGGRIQRQMATREMQETRETQKAQLNPTWVEWLMGWPLGWTDLRPSGTGKFQQWLHSHGRYFLKTSPNTQNIPKRHPTWVP
jgi:hypothetical protein